MSNETVKKTPATKVITGKVRLSYVNIFKPRANDEGTDPKYSVSILIPKSDKITVEKIKKAIEASKVQDKDKLVNKNGKYPADMKSPLRDGDDKDDEAYQGHYFVNCSSKRRPGIVDRDRVEITDSEQVYSGCYARVSINFYGFNFNGNKGVAAGLNNIQFICGGERLSGGSSPEEDFNDELEYEDLAEDILD